MESLRIDVIVPAAGVGKRMQLSIPKQYAKIGKLTVLEHTVYALLKCPYVNKVIVGVSDTDEYFDSLEISSHPQVIKGIGGKERSDTVRLNMDKVTTEYVMVHDAARPLVKVEDLNKLSLLAKNHVDGAMLAVKCADTLKKVIDGKVVTTVPRENIYRAYTPQMGKTKLLQKALNYANDNHLAITDDASALELIGCEVLIVEGSADNFKLTTHDDLKMAKILIEDIHV